MGLFGKRKERKQEISDVIGAVTDNLAMSRQAAAKAMAQSGVDPASVAAMTQQAMAPGAMGAMLAQRDRIVRLNQSGVDTPATLRAVQMGDPSPGGYAVEAALDWTVRPAGGVPYDVHSVDTVHANVVASLVAGAQCTVRVDPDDPQSVMFWGTSEPAAPAPGAAAPEAGDALGRLSKLGELRDQGLITDDEFAARKAEILGS
jgi:hypothetical protein